MLKECARGYVLSGKPLADICEHNASVARRIGKNYVAMLWTFIKIVYSSTSSSCESFRNAAATQSLSRMLMTTQNSMPQVWGDEKADDQMIIPVDAIHDDEAKASEFSVPKMCEAKPAPHPTNNGLLPNANLDIVYGDTELTVEHIDCIKSLRNGFLYIGPHDLSKSIAFPNDTMMNHDMQQNARNQAMTRNRQGASPVSRSASARHSKSFHALAFSRPTIRPC